MANEKEQLNLLQKLRDKLSSMTVGELIAGLIDVATTYHQGHFMEMLNSIAEDYNRMKFFMRQGSADLMRSHLYDDYRQRLRFVLSQMIHQLECKTVNTLANSIKQSDGISLSEMENRLVELSQNVTISQLADETDLRRAYQQLYNFRNKVFCAVYAAGPMTETDSGIIENLFSNESVDAVDRQLLVSALMLSQQRSFDSSKFHLLIRLLRMEKSEEVQLRIVVALCLTLPDENQILLDPSMKDAFNECINEKGYLRHLLNLQSQMLHSVTAADDRKKMDREIMPSIMDEMKRQNLMNPDASSLDDVLHPDNEEKAMDAMEEKLSKMRKMQESGSDMLFGGFSAMKRYIFFYTLMNWFCPYSVNHPDVSRLCSDPAMKPLLDSLSDATQLCDSDKFSMAFGLNHVFNSLPQQLRQMLQSGEAKIGILDEELTNDLNYRRRMYLQNLYRFYNLYSSKQDFQNPFVDVNRWCFVLHPFILGQLSDSNFLISFAHKLIQKDRIADAERVLLADKSHEGSVDYLVLRGTCHVRCHRYDEAVNCYQQALFLDSGNTKLRHRLASVAIEAHKWNIAAMTFDDILRDDPENTDAILGLSEALLHQRNLKEASSRLLPFDFIDNPTNKMSSLIGWYYLLAGKPQMALESYKRIEVEELTQNDLLRLVFVHLCLKDNATATATLAMILKKINGAMDIATELSQDYLDIAGITLQEWDILVDLAKDEQ